MEIVWSKGLAGSNPVPTAMKLIKTIKDKELEKIHKTREAARAVLFDEGNLMPILFVSKYKYHKLPGGGIKEGENVKEALIREIKEEVGSTIEIGEEVGMVAEYRSEWNLEQFSYCFLGRVISKGESKLEDDEKDAGFELKWVSISEAIDLIKNDRPEDYEGNFIRERDLALLEEANQIITGKV